MDLRQVAAALGGDVSNGSVLAPGPGHSNADRSLSVKLDASAPDGFLVHSFANDDPIICRDYVREKCGWPAFKPNNKRHPRSSDEVAQLVAAAVQMQKQPRRGTHTATYRYEDRDGALLYEVLRYDNPKSFRARRPGGNGDWIDNLDGFPRRVLYRWPELLKFAPCTVFVTEGEKDANRVASLDHCATTVAFGKWTEECVQGLADCDVLILADNDAAGCKKACEAATNLYGAAATVRIVRLPDLGEGEDVSDWLDKDQRNKDRLIEICFSAPLWSPEQQTANAQPKSVGLSAWRYHSEAAPEPISWLVKNVVPQSGAGLISGQWGSYKTTVALDLAVSVMSGAAFAGRHAVKRTGGVVYFAAEGAGGLASRLNAIAAQRGYAGTLPFAWRSDCPPLTAPDALARLATEIAQAAAHLEVHHSVPLALILIDTLIAAAGYAKIGDENDAAVAQKIMSVLSKLSAHTSTLVLGIDHFGKVIETGTRGSSAKEGHADVVLAILADRELGGTVANTRLAVRKLRDGIAGIEIPFSPKIVQLGTDEDSDPITRVVIDWEAAPAKLASETDWAKSLQLLRRILMTMLADHGTTTAPFADGPVVRAVDLELVRAEFCRQYVAEGTPRQKTDARRHAFNRAVKSAQAKALIAMREVDGTQLVWLTRP
jgi:hypothetical protein